MDRVRIADHCHRVDDMGEGEAADLICFALVGVGGVAIDRLSCAAHMNPAWLPHTHLPTMNKHDLPDEYRKRMLLTLQARSA